METVLKSAQTPMEAFFAHAVLVISLVLITLHAMVSLSLLLKSFTSDVISCIDVNECSVLNGDCSQLCTNTIGSYFCTCISGYFLTVNNKTCNGESVINSKSTELLTIMNCVAFPH